MLLNADLAAATNALRNVTITEATLLQCHNNFGVPLGVSINCLPKNEVIDTGDRQGHFCIAVVTVLQLLQFFLHILDLLFDSWL